MQFSLHIALSKWYSGSDTRSTGLAIDQTDNWSVLA
jgi:hypothetical protein